MSEWRALRPRASRWLVEHLVPLGTAGLLCEPDDVTVSLSGLDLALKVAQPPVVRQEWRGHPVVAFGRGVVLCAADDKASVMRRLGFLDPDGRRRASCGDRLAILAGLEDPAVAAPLFTFEAGQAAPTIAARKLWSSLRSIDQLKLVVFDRLPDFLPTGWFEPECACAVSIWMGDLAAETGATVLAMLNGEEARLQEMGEARWLDLKRQAKCVRRGP